MMAKITFRALRNERASVFVSGLILVAVMTMLAGALFDLSLLGSRMFRDSSSTAQALYCVEAGGARALAEIVPAPDDPLSWDGVPQNLPTPTGDCEYVATYANTANPKILIATGTLGSVSRTLKWTAKSSSPGTILIGGNLEISGSPIVGGTCGSVHANADLSIPGNPTIAEDATATGTYSASGTPIVGGESGGGRPYKTVPDIDPAKYLNTAKSSLPANEVFQMLWNGQVLDGDGNELAVLAGGEIYRGWEFKVGSDPRWIYGDNIAFDGTYYLEEGVAISADPGSQSLPWKVTIITTGNAEVSGSPKMSTHLEGTMFVAGLDIKINGNAEQTFNGLIGAREQIDISGAPNVNGFLVAEDTGSTSGLVTENKIGGDPGITYNCEYDPSGVLTWTWGECADPSCGT